MFTHKNTQYHRNRTMTQTLNVYIIGIWPRAYLNPSVVSGCLWALKVATQSHGQMASLKYMSPLQLMVIKCDQTSGKC